MSTRAAYGVLLVWGLAIHGMVACSVFRSPPADVQLSAAKNALIAAYEARLDAVIDQSATCPAAVAAVRDEEARWSPIWAKLDVPKAAPKALVCPGVAK